MFSQKKYNFFIRFCYKGMQKQIGYGDLFCKIHFINHWFKMRRHGWKFILFLLPLLLYGMLMGYLNLNDGFIVWKIRSDPISSADWEAPSIDLEKKKEINTILAQKFFYLSKGTQSYCFVSEDGRYVLKFIKQHKCRSLWDNFLKYPLPGWLQERAQAKIEKAKECKKGIFTSYVLAYNRLKEEAGLIYLQIKPSSITDHKTTLVDRLGFKHLLDLNQMVFALQQKAELIGERIDRLMLKNDVQGAKETIQALLSLFYRRCQKGVKDTDMGKFCLNYGFIGNRPISVDIGQFILDEELVEPAVVHHEVQVRTGAFIKWLKDRHPDLTAFVEDLLIKEMAMENTVQAA